LNQRNVLSLTQSLKQNTAGRRGRGKKTYFESMCLSTSFFRRIKKKQTQRCFRECSHTSPQIRPEVRSSCCTAKLPVRPPLATNRPLALRQHTTPDATPPSPPSPLEPAAAAGAWLGSGGGEQWLGGRRGKSSKGGSRRQHASSALGGLPPPLLVVVGPPPLLLVPLMLVPLLLPLGS
jgi:hypothetical protein